MFQEENRVDILLYLFFLFLITIYQIKGGGVLESRGGYGGAYQIFLERDQRTNVERYSTHC